MEPKQRKGGNRSPNLSNKVTSYGKNKVRR